MTPILDIVYVLYIVYIVYILYILYILYTLYILYILYIVYSCMSQIKIWDSKKISIIPGIFYSDFVETPEPEIFL